jgi:ABC-2 type transport system ATP-binding protein
MPPRWQTSGVNAVSAGDTELTPTESYKDAMTDATIEMTGVRKRYGKTLALDGMSFSVQPGRVTGFIGPNGAGKSTSMRVILGLDAPDEGTAFVCGQPYRTLHRPLTQVGALLDADALQPSRSGRNHLLWMARSQCISVGRVDEVIDMVGLTGAAKRKAGGYSLGMRQRLGIAAAMLGDPPTVMMDEPFNGIDPEGIIWMRGFLRSLAAEGRAILISSHLMSELEDVVDHVVVVGRGKVLADATIEELVARASHDTVTVITDAPADAAAAIQGAGGTASITSTDRLEVAGLQPRRVVEILSDKRVSFSEVTSQRANLEDVYLQLTAGEAEFEAHCDVRGQR